MKKVILLCALALMGAQSLKCMEVPEQHYKELPHDLKQEIIDTALATSNNLDEAVAMIKKLSILQHVPYNSLFSNLKDFTTLVHKLADRFNLTMTDKIAEKIGTPTAKKYINLGAKIAVASSGGWEASEKIDKINALIAQGADPNYKGKTEWEMDSGITALEHVFRTTDTTNIVGTVADAKQLVQLLISYGAIPDEQLIRSLDRYLSDLKFYPTGKALGAALDAKVDEIRKMLQAAMKNKKNKPYNWVEV